MQAVAVFCHYFFHLLKRLQCNMWYVIICLFKERNILIRNISRSARELKSKTKWKTMKEVSLSCQASAVIFFSLPTIKQQQNTAFRLLCTGCFKPWYQDISIFFLNNLRKFRIKFLYYPFFLESILNIWRDSFLRCIWQLSHFFWVIFDRGHKMRGGTQICIKNERRDTNFTSILLMRTKL